MGTHLIFYISGITLGFYAENGFNRIETPSEAYPETYFADSPLGLDLYFN
jgi:hypothetical protein